MKCPVILTRDVQEGEVMGITAGDCLKEECAWWSSDIECCDPTNLSRKFDTLIMLLLGIANKKYINVQLAK